MIVHGQISIVENGAVVHQQAIHANSVAMAVHGDAARLYNFYRNSDMAVGYVQVQDVDGRERRFKRVAFDVVFKEY